MNLPNRGNTSIKFGIEPPRWPWPKQPHTCPVCKGKGQVPLGFYSGNGHALSNSTMEKCRSCQGRGIVWQS